MSVDRQHLRTQALECLAGSLHYWIAPPENASAGGIFGMMIPQSIFDALSWTLHYAVHAWQDLPIDWIMAFADIMKTAVSRRRAVPGKKRLECHTLNLLISISRARVMECTSSGAKPLAYVLCRPCIAPAAC
jgi:hypothetical protein